MKVIKYWFSFIGLLMTRLSFTFLNRTFHPFQMEIGFFLTSPRLSKIWRITSGEHKTGANKPEIASPTTLRVD